MIDNFHWIDTDRFDQNESVDAQLAREIAGLRLCAADEDRMWDVAETFSDDEIFAGTTISIPKWTTPFGG